MYLEPGRGGSKAHDGGARSLRLPAEGRVCAVRAVCGHLQQPRMHAVKTCRSATLSVLAVRPLIRRKSLRRV